MTTTDIFQIKPDFFPSPEECQKNEYKKINTNPRYKHFNQTHFTAGDIEQFQEYRNKTNGNLNSLELEENDEFPIPPISWEKYKNLNTYSVDNTFNYLFHKFKKAIFIKIKNGKLDVFLPFSNKNYRNEWSHKIKIDPKHGDLLNFIKKVQLASGYKFFPNSVNKFIDSWYSNNCLVRYEYPVGEGDTNNTQFSDMFKILCQERTLPDMEFFINRRDFPLLKIDGTEPYNHIFDSESMKLLSHNYDTYAPILSMVSAPNYADIPIPTGDDWARISAPENKFFVHNFSKSFILKPVSWKTKKPIAVFRGSSTGSGITIETNTRLKLAYISKTTKSDSDGLPLLDAGITDWNLRPRKLQGEKYLVLLEPEKLPFKLAKKLTPQEQAEYKYVINVDGHVSAYRLSMELESGSVVLLVNSKYKLWYRDMLEPFTHFVPIKEDLSDLVEKILWCKANDSKCKKIASNALAFTKKYLSKDGILNYLQKLLFEIKKVNGTYVYHSISLAELQYKKENKILERESNNSALLEEYPNGVLHYLPKQERSYNLLKGLEWAIKYSTNFNPVFKKEIFNNKNTVISEHSFLDTKIIKKTYTNKHKLTHETFVSVIVLNNLLKKIPNFRYTFGYKDSSLFQEHINGITLNDYIHSEGFVMKDFLFILIQISLSLFVAQNNCCFIHNDLTPWNILLVKSKPVYHDYIIDYKTVYRVKTSLIPIIIDMGRAHVVYKNRHYGPDLDNKPAFSSIRDIITLLLTSIYEISNFNMTRQEVKELIILANFLSGTTYRKHPFIETGANGLGEIRYFFHNAKKYTEIILTNYHELELKSPLDFLNYVMKTLGKFSIEITNHLQGTFNQGNERQVFEYILASTIEEKARSYAMVFHRLLNSELEIPPDNLLSKYTLQTIQNNLSSVYNLMLIFLKENNIDPKLYIRKYNKAIEYVEKTFTLEDSDEDLKIQEYPMCNYTNKIFSNPKELIKTLADPSLSELSLAEDISLYKEMIEEVLLSGFSHESNVELLSLNSASYKNSLANIVSLRETAFKLYSANFKLVKDTEGLEDYKEDCKEIKNLSRPLYQL